VDDRLRFNEKSSDDELSCGLGIAILRTLVETSPRMRRGVGCRAGIAVAFVPVPDPGLAISAGVLCNANTRFCSTRFRSIWAAYLGRWPESPYADALLIPGAVCSLRKGVWSVRDVDVVVQNMKSREDEHNIDPHASDLLPILPLFSMASRTSSRLNSSEATNMSSSTSR
jgi:hypothetical protein